MNLKRLTESVAEFGLRSTFHHKELKLYQHIPYQQLLDKVQIKSFLFPSQILATCTYFSVSMHPHRVIVWLVTAVPCCVMSRYELQRGVSTTSSQLDETEQPDTTALEDGDDLSHKEVKCSSSIQQTTPYLLILHCHGITLIHINSLEVRMQSSATYISKRFYFLPTHKIQYCDWPLYLTVCLSSFDLVQFQQQERRHQHISAKQRRYKFERDY